jgi:hypothetical protein
MTLSHFHEAITLIRNNNKKQRKIHQRRSKDSMKKYREIGQKQLKFSLEASKYSLKSIGRFGTKILKDSAKNIL